VGGKTNSQIALKVQQEKGCDNQIVSRYQIKYSGNGLEDRGRGGSTSL